MSVQYILNSDYNTIKNEKLTQALEVTTSLKAPVHYVDTIALSNNAGKLNANAVIEATQMEAAIGIFESITIDEILPTDGPSGVVSLNGILSIDNDEQSVIKNLKMGKLETYVNGNGSENQVLSLDSNLDLIWKDDAQADVSQWATYSAVQNVDMDGNELQNASKVKSNEVDINEYTIVQGNATAEPVFKSLIFNPPENYGYVSFGNSTNSSNVEIVGDGTFVAYNGGFEGGNFRTYNTSLSLVTGNFNKDGLLIKDSATATDTAFYLDAGTKIAKLPYINRDLNSSILYVVPNTNVSGFVNGTMESPFNSLQAAVNWVTDNHDNKYWTINVAPGTYSNGISIQYPNMSIVGNTNSFYGSTQTIIDASVNINVDNTYVGNLHGHQLSFENLYFNETVNNNCVGDVCVNFKSCYFYVNEVAYTDSSIVSTQSRLRFIDCYLLSTNSLSTNPLVNVSQGMLACSQTQFEVVGNQNCLSLSTNAVVDVVSMCKFTSSYATSTKPLVEITSNVSGSYSFTNCGFVYANASTNDCSGVYSHPASGSNNVVVLYCSFYMTGLAAGPTNYVVKSSNSVVLYYSNNALVGYASAIQGTNGVNKFSMTAVA